MGLLLSKLHQSRGLLNASKRLVETPKRRRDSSPCRKSVRVNSAKASCKFLFESTAQQSQQALNDCIDSNFNIDDLPTDGALQVKVVIIDKTSKATTTNPQEEESKQIVHAVPGVQCDNCVTRIGKQLQIPF